MKHVFLDFEMNPTTKPAGKQRSGKRPPPPPLRMEIIEIGAVKLNEAYEQIEQFSCFVKPDLNTITKKVTEITGIKDADLQDAVSLEVALANFVDWIGSEPTRIYAWSESDLKQLKEECKFKRIYLGDAWPEAFKRWMDFQKVYTRIMGLSRSLSLTNAIMLVDNDFEGHQHSALADAENSAMLLTLVKNKEKFKEKTAGIKKVFNTQEPLTSSIGDLLAAQLAKLNQ